MIRLEYILSNDISSLVLADETATETLAARFGDAAAIELANDFEDCHLLLNKLKSYYEEKVKWRVDGLVSPLNTVANLISEVQLIVLGGQRGHQLTSRERRTFTALAVLTLSTDLFHKD